MAASTHVRRVLGAQLGALLFFGTACLATRDESLGKLTPHASHVDASAPADEPLIDPPPALDAAISEPPHEFDAGVAEDAGHEIDSGYDAAATDASAHDAGYAGDAAHDGGHCREPWEPWECRDH